MRKYLIFTFCTLPLPYRLTLNNVRKERVKRMLWMVISRLNNDHGGLTVTSFYSLRWLTEAGYLDPEIQLKTAHGKEVERIFLIFMIFEVIITFSEKGTATLKGQDVTPGMD